MRRHFTKYKLGYAAALFVLLAVLFCVAFQRTLYLTGSIFMDVVAPTRSYTYKREGEMKIGPDEAIKYARLALAERVMDTGEYNVFDDPRSSSPDSWLVQFTLKEDLGFGWWHAWNVWLEFKEDEVEARIAPNM
jgi:hypothetical protein